MRRAAVATYAELLDPAHFARQYTFLTPATDLRPYVECYWQLDLRGAHWATQDFQEMLLASLHASLVVNLGTAFEVTGVAGQAVLPCTRSVCVSQQAEPGLYRLSPLSARLPPLRAARAVGGPPIVAFLQ